MSTEHKMYRLNVVDLVQWWGFKEKKSFFPADPDEWPAIIRAYIREKVGFDVNDEQAVSSLVKQLHQEARNYVEWVKENHTIH